MRFPRFVRGATIARLCCGFDQTQVRVLAQCDGQPQRDRLAKIAPACRISRARVVDSGRIVTAGGIASGMELGFHLLRRAGYSEDFVAEVARVMEYSGAYELYREDVDWGANERHVISAGAIE